MESNVKVEAGQVVMPKVPPRPEMFCIAYFRSGVWDMDWYSSEESRASAIKRHGLETCPRSLFRIPGEEVQRGE